MGVSPLRIPLHKGRLILHLEPFTVRFVFVHMEASFPTTLQICGSQSGLLTTTTGEAGAGSKPFWDA